MAVLMRARERWLCRLGLHRWDHSLFSWGVELAKDRTCLRCGRVQESEVVMAVTSSGASAHKTA